IRKWHCEQTESGAGKQSIPPHALLTLRRARRQRSHDTLDRIIELRAHVEERDAQLFARRLVLAADLEDPAHRPFAGLRRFIGKPPALCRRVRTHVSMLQRGIDAELSDETGSYLVRVFVTLTRRPAG